VTDTVRLVIEEPQGVPTLYGDEGKVAQILRNLLSNALKFTEHGEVRLRAGLDASGTRVVIAVSDTGIGIAAADQARIFEEFGQLEHAVQRRVKGTGLGLALSRRLAELLGGDLSVESVPGEGSTFTLRLPLAFIDELDAQHAPPPLIRAAPRILVIDDDEISRYVVRGLADELGIGCDEATGALEGLDCVSRLAPSAVVLDLVMPDLPGGEVLRRLRAHPATAGLPVVIATSQPLEPAERAALEALGAVVMAKSVFSSGAASGRLREALMRAGLVP